MAVAGLLVAGLLAVDAPASAAPSAPVRATAPRAVPTPAKPTIVPGDGFVEVSWSQPTPAGSIDGYRITQYDGSNTTPSRTIDVGPLVLRRRIYDLDDDQVYAFTVSAHAGSWGSPSPKAGNYGPARLWPFTTADALAAQQRPDFAGRATTPIEIDKARATLGGSGTPGWYILNVARTPEAAPMAAMARLYLAYFQRPPDPGGYGYWIGKLRSGTKLEKASSTFAASSEFARTYGSRTNREFVQLVYQNVLGRAPDSAGLSYWTSALDRKVRSRGAVMTQFSESSENVRKRTPAVETLVLWFGMLRSTPSQTELETTVARIADGLQTSAFADELFQSETYRKRFGRQTGAPIQAPGTVRSWYWGNLSASSAVVNPSGRTAYVVNDRTHTVDVFDVTDSKMVASIPASPDVRSIAISPDGSRLLFGSPADRTIEIYDTAKLAPVVVPAPLAFTAPEYPTGFAPLDDGRVVVALYDGNKTDIVAINLVNGDRTSYLDDLRDPVVQASADGRYLAVFAESGLWVVDTHTATVTPKRYLATDGGFRIRPWGADGFIVGRTKLVDHTGAIVSDVPDTAYRSTMASDPTGARGYRFQGNDLQVVNLVRALPNRQTPVPPYGPTISPQDIGVSADGSTIISAMAQGMVIAGAPTSLDPEPLPYARGPRSPFIPTAGQNEQVKLSDVKVSPDSATVWAVNQGLNQIEVFDAQTRDRLAVIKLGAVPSSLDFSPNGAKAYVVGPGSGLVTVIDTSTQTVVDRFDLPAPNGYWGPPERIAVAADGKLLVSRIDNVNSSPTSTYVTVVDPTTKAEVPGAIRPTAGWPLRLVASGDRSKTLLPTTATGSTARWYVAATGTFTAPAVRSNYSFNGVGVDQTGSRVFGGRVVYDGDLTALGAIATPKSLPYLAGISPDGTRGYRVEGNVVKVLDLSAFGELRSASTDDTGTPHNSQDEGAFAVSADGHIVAVITPGGLSILQDP